MNKKVINYVFCFISYLALGIAYPSTSFETLSSRIHARFSVSAYESLLAMIIIVLLVLFQHKIKLDIFKKSYWPYWLLGSILSIFYVITMSVYQAPSDNITYVPSLMGKTNLLITLVALCGFAFIFTNFGIFLGQVISKLRVSQFYINYWYIVIGLGLIWIIQIFPLFPGMVSWDGYRQFLEFFHTHVAELDFTYYPTNHHPWFSTLVFGSLFSIGEKIAGPNFGLFLIVLVQIIISSLVYAKVVRFIGECWGKKAAVVAFIFYASPFVAFWQVTIEKTPLFLAFTTMFVLCYAKILVANLKTELPMILYVQLIVSGILMSLFRNDGSYVVILSLFVLLVVQIVRNKRMPRQLIIGLAVFLSVYVGWNKVALPTMNVVSGSTAEVISLPMRQLSAVVINHPESLSKKDLATINKITPVKEIKNHFNVNNADNLKSLYPVDSFLRSSYEIKQLKLGHLKKEATPKIKKQTGQYLMVWFKQLLKHPKTYVVTFFAADSSFLNPVLDSNPDSRGIMYGNEYMKYNTFLQPSWYPEIHYWFSDATRKYIKWPNTVFSLPIIRTILQPAFALWAVLFSFAYCLYKKSYSALIFIPIGLLAVVPLLSPVNGMERYMLPAIYTLPLLLAVIVNVNKESKKKMKKVYKELVAVVGIAVTTAILFNAIFFVPIRLPWDAYYHVSRIENLRQSGLAFLYPQNFTTLGQYGLATNIFYPALTLQIVQTIFFFTHSAIQAFKISMIFTTFLSGTSVYIILRYHSKLGRKIAFFCSILWLSTIGITALAPGNIAESTAYIGIPWLAYGLYACSKETNMQLKKIIAHIAVGLSIAAYSHVMTFFILTMFTAVYLFILLIKSNHKIKIVWVITLGGIVTLLSTAAAIGPILIVQLLNNVKKPVVSTSVFANNVKDLSHLFLNPSDSPDIWLPLFFIMICIVVGYRKPSLGVVLGLIVMLLGTNFTPWSYYLRNSPVTFIQFATRFIKPGIALALMFTLLDLKANQKTHENTKRFHSGLITYGLISVIIMAGVVKNNWFPNSNSQLWMAQQLKEYTTFYDGIHDGYGYSSDMTFSNQISNNERFWYLKNYTDYIPKSALSNPNDKSTFIGADKSGILLTKHQIIDERGQTYNTNNYNPTLKSINMNVQKMIPSNSIIELPILSYKGLRVNTTIDGKQQKTFIKHGKIALKLQDALAANSKIKITQQVPNWLIVLNLVSAVTLVTLLSFHKRPQRTDRLT